MGNICVKLKNRLKGMMADMISLRGLLYVMYSLLLALSLYKHTEDVVGGKIYIVMLFFFLALVAFLIDFKNYNISASILVFCTVLLVFKMFDYDLFQNINTTAVIKDYEVSENWEIIQGGGYEKERIFSSRPAVYSSFV